MKKLSIIALTTVFTFISTFASEATKIPQENISSSGTSCVNDTETDDDDVIDLTGFDLDENLTVIEDDEGWTPLHDASYDGNVELVRSLLAANETNINQASKDGATPLFITLLTRNTEIAKLLLTNNRIDVNTPYNDGSTPLIVAVVTDNTEIAKLLLANNTIDVNKSDDLGHTPLWWATVKKDTEIIELLSLANGIDINKADNSGITPLHMSLAMGNAEIVKLLLKYGANQDLEIEKGKKPIDLPHKQEIKTLLLQNLRERSFYQYIWYLMKDILKSFLDLILHLIQ